MSFQNKNLRESKQQQPASKATHCWQRTQIESASLMARLIAHISTPHAYNKQQMKKLGMHGGDCMHHSRCPGWHAGNLTHKIASGQGFANTFHSQSDVPDYAGQQDVYNRGKSGRTMMAATPCKTASPQDIVAVAASVQSTAGMQLVGMSPNPAPEVSRAVLPSCHAPNCKYT